MNIPFLTLSYQHKQIEEEIFKKFHELYDRTEFVHHKTAREFEEKFANYNDIDYACALDTGTSAVELALRACNIGPGDEVITVSNTFIATVAAIYFAGATPVFVDIDEKTWNIDINKIEEKITPKTKAILPVHLYGQPADVVKISEIARKHGLKLIGDSAQAIGAKVKYNDEWVFPAKFCDASSFSFYPGKNLGACGEAGAVVTKDESVAKFISMFRDHGSSEKYIHEFPGKNNRIDAFQAAALLVKMNYIDDWTAKRQVIAGWYKDRLENIDQIKCQYTPENLMSVYHLFVVTVDNRKEFQDYLADNGIGTGIHYKIPVHLQKAFEYLNYQEGSLPVTEKVVKSNVSLPMYPELKEEEVDYVCEVIKNYFNKKD